jgi:hypothetical protein
LKLLIRGLGLTLLCLVLSGCALRSACQPAPYMDAKPRGALVVPAGMGRPEQSAALRVPAAGSVGGRLANDPDNCIIEPPEFYAAPGSSSVAARPRQDAAGADGRVLLTGAEGEVAAFLERWASLWSARDVDGWLGLYAADYAAAGYADAASWRTEQRQRFEIPATTRIDLDTLAVESSPDGVVRARFVQRFGTAPTERAVSKELVLLAAGDGGWRIIDERVLEVL